jgi:acyl-CoA synthetase (NDP forming)
MEKHGLCLPVLSEAVQNELKEVLPVDGSIFTNPLDTPNMSTPKAISAAMAIMGKIPEIQTLFYHMGFHPISRWGINRFMADNYGEKLAQELVEARKASGKPILLALRPPGDIGGMEEFLDVQKAAVKAKIPVFYDLDRLVLAVSRVAAWLKNKTASMESGR